MIELKLRWRGGELLVGCCLVLTTGGCGVPDYRLSAAGYAGGALATNGGSSWGADSTSGGMSTVAWVSAGGFSGASSNPEAVGGGMAFQSSAAAGGATLATNATTAPGAIGGTLSVGGATPAPDTLEGDSVSAAGGTRVIGSSVTGSIRNTGGAFAQASNSATGGTLASGGTVATTRTTATSATNASGGNPASGGALPTGGTLASSIAMVTGGAAGTGGAVATGGSMGSGGATAAVVACSTYVDLGTLPGSSNASQSVPTASTCYRYSVSDGVSQIHGFGMYNCDTRTASINGNDCTMGCSTIPIARDADGYWYVKFSQGVSSTCVASWWWY